VKNFRETRPVVLCALILTAFALGPGPAVAAPQGDVGFHYTYAMAVRLIRGEVALDCRGECRGYRVRHCRHTVGERARCELSAWLPHRKRPCRTGLSAWRRPRPEEGPFFLPAERWIEFNVDNEESRCVMQIFPFGLPPSPPPPPTG
jgi:hypothetical protein